MTIMTLGSDQAAISTLLSAIGSTQAAMTAAEVDLSYNQGPIFGIAANQTDFLFNALCSPTVIGRLESEDPLHPSAIILNRLNSAAGAPCVQVAFNSAAQVAIFVGASNWIASLSNPQLGALEVATTVKANLRRLSGRFQGSPLPQALGVQGRGNITANTTQKAAAGAAVKGAGRVSVDTAVTGP